MAFLCFVYRKRGGGGMGCVVVYIVNRRYDR
jgi:hypothetical protein